MLLVWLLLELMTKQGSSIILADVLGAYLQRNVSVQ